jgi:SPP1 family predicted phage head-tail adaptor
VDGLQAVLKGSVLNPSIRAGELVHSIQIQQPQYGQTDSFGGSVTPATWNTVRTARAAIYTAGGRETSMASQIVSDVSHVVKVRWTDIMIRANYRVFFQSRFFTVQYAENVLERNRVLLLYCLEVDSGGGG